MMNTRAREAMGARKEIVEQTEPDRLRSETRPDRWKRRRGIEQFRERALVPTRDGLYAFRELKEAFERPGRFEAYGWTDVGILHLGKVSFDLSGNIPIAVKMYATDMDTGETLEGWITLEFTEDGTARYVSSIHREPLETVSVPESFAMEWLMRASESSKVVKSRPMWAYPTLFDLPHDEVWPRDANVAVIGDPFQACDREGVTIVEYQYAEELIPPSMFDAALGKDAEHFDGDRVYRWLRSLYAEDIEFAGKMYGMFTPYRGNPYAEFSDKCLRACGRLAAELARSGGVGPEARAWIAKTEAFGKRLVDGTWGLDEAAALLGFGNAEHVRAKAANRSEENYSSPEADLLDFFNYKQEVMEKLGVSEAWADFVSRWDAYLKAIDTDAFATAMGRDEAESLVRQARHWLAQLPASKSVDRVANGMGFLDDFLSDTSRFCTDEDALDGVVTAKTRGVGEVSAFGFFVPGYPVNQRTRKTIEEMVSRMRQTVLYADQLAPLLRAERDRLEHEDIPLSQDTLERYLRSLERRFVSQHFFKRRTQRAVPIHGFFPYKMQEIDPQDRILALTSVTMHGWNRMGREEFRRDILTALPYLKVGGKYILGPVNQYVYFGGRSEGFDAEGLTDILRQLRDDGTIEYRFQKGTRNSVSMPDDQYGGDDPTDEWDQDDQVLHEDESAASLVITRLK